MPNLIETAGIIIILLNTLFFPAALRAAGFLRDSPMPMGSTTELENRELREEEE